VAVKKMIVIIIITTLTLIVFFGGCVTPSDGTPARIKTWGTVADNTSTGGFYSIITDNGTRYVPVNFNTSTAPGNGTRVYFEAVIVKNASADNQKGIPIEIYQIGSYVPPLHTVRINLTKED
jgi:hypothetical protein